MRTINDIPIYPVGINLDLSFPQNVNNTLGAFREAIYTNMINNTGQYDPNFVYKYNNTAKWNGELYLYTNYTPSSGHMPTDENYWYKITESGKGIEWKETYSDDTLYEILNAVEYEGKVYLCIVPESKGNLPTDQTKWKSLTIVGPQGEQGIQGIQGPQGEQGPVGPIGMRWQRAYSPDTDYAINDGVSHLGRSYIALQPSKGIAPPNTDYWDCFADKGSDGAGGDMFKSTYDTDNDGKVDSSEDADKLGGQLPVYYAKQDNLSTLSNTVSSHLADNTAHGIGNLPNKTYVDLGDLISSIQISKGLFTVQAQISAGKQALNQLVIDAFNDASGINAGASTGYTFDSTNKSVKASSYTADLSTSAQAISGGDNANVKGNAFDNDLGTFWGSSQTTSGVSGVAYIGQDFGATPRHIRKIRINQFDIAYVTSLIVQWSDNGSSWTSVLTDSSITHGVWYDIVLPATATHRYWRLLANSSSAGSWGMNEIEMMEAIASPGTIIMTADTASSVPTKSFISSDYVLNGGTLTAYISRDGGASYTVCALDTVTDISSQPSGTSIVVKIVLTGSAELKALAWGWK